MSQKEIFALQGQMFALQCWELLSSQLTHPRRWKDAPLPWVWAFLKWEIAEQPPEVGSLQEVPPYSLINTTPQALATPFFVFFFLKTKLGNVANPQKWRFPKLG